MASPRKSEISVEEAAEHLQVSSRMIRTYLQEKKIQGIKVGRQWFIDLASLEAFGKKSGFEVPEEKAAPREGLAEPASDRPTRSSERSRLTHLACYRLCLEAFQMPLWKAAEEPLGPRLRALRSDIVEALGAGYYSFGRAKIEWYSQARGLLGAGLGLLYSEEDYFKTYGPEITFIETKLMPAFSALLRKLERGDRPSQRSWR